MSTLAYNRILYSYAGWVIFSSYEQYGLDPICVHTLYRLITYFLHLF